MEEMQATLRNMLVYANELISCEGMTTRIKNVTGNIARTVREMIAFYELPFTVKYYEELELYTLEHIN